VPGRLAVVKSTSFSLGEADQARAVINAGVAGFIASALVCDKFASA
jgi:hypothetical protein